MIDLSLRGEVYELSMGVAPCNEIGTGVLASLEDALEQIDPARARALIVHSSVEKGFCAGADLRELFSAMQASPEGDQAGELSEFLDRVHRVMNTLDALPLTTIGAVHGVCFGGGFELALTLDLLVADHSARFAFPELRLGLIPGFGGIPRLRREVGNAFIRDLLLTGRSINAKKAGSLGLVSQVVARGKALDVARHVAERATSFAPQAAMTAKGFIKAVPLAELEEEKAHFKRLFASPDVVEALRRFVESDDLRPYL